MQRVLVMAMLGCLATASAAFGQIAEDRNEAIVNVTLSSTKPTDDAGDRFTVFDWETIYQRFLTDRLSVGPGLVLYKETGIDLEARLGPYVAYHFGDLDATVVPFAELGTLFGFGSDFTPTAGLRLRGGIKIPMGRTGGRFKVSVDWIRDWYDEDVTGFDSFKAFGVSWGAGLLF